MKKLAATLLAASLLLVLLASCGMYGASDVVGMPEGAPKSMDYASAADDSGMLLLSESYRKLTENPFYYTQNVNKSYFSLDSFTASYANLRRYIQNNQAINGDIIKTDELINYFHYDYPRPAEGETFLASAALTDAPWNADHKLLTLAVTTKEADPFDNQGRNFVFLIDVSGSMSGAGRLPLVKEALSLLIDELADSDTVSIVTYASGVSVKADGLRGTQKNRLKSIVNGLNASGGTYGEGGINKAYEIAAKHFVSGGNNRIIVASDGDFNIGASSQTGLEQLITGKRESGVYLTCLGFGMYNYHDVTMETLAKWGNGGYAYIDTIEEAQKVLVEDLNKTLTVVSKDTKTMVEFDPAVVSSYRLIGYENKQLSEQDFNDEDKDAGEIGSGHTSVVCYELVMRGSAQTDRSAVRVEIRYKDPADDAAKSYERSFAIADMAAPSADDRFVSALVEFSLVLRDSPYKANASYDALLARLDGLDLSADAYKDEFRRLARTAKERGLVADPSYADFCAVTVVFDSFYTIQTHKRGEILTEEELREALGGFGEGLELSFYYDATFSERYVYQRVDAALTLFVKAEAAKETTEK